MKTYSYKGFDRDGKACRGLVEALTRKEAREKLAGRAILAEHVFPTGARVRLSSEVRSLVYRELAALLRAGMPMVRGLDILVSSPELSAYSGALAGIRDRITEGQSLADSLAAGSSSVSVFERAIVEASEAAATVPSMLDHLASLLEEEDQLRNKVRSALIYPALVVVVGVIVAGVMLGVLIPRTETILQYGHGTLPALTRWVMVAGRAMLRWGGFGLLVALMGLLVHRRKLRDDEAYAVAWDASGFRWPVYGRAREIVVNLRFARTLSMLLRSGVSLMDGVLLAGRAAGSPAVAAATKREAESIRHGASLSEALRRVPALAGSLPGWIQVGEASGELPDLLESASRRYADAWDRFSQRTLSMLEPLLLLAVGGFVLLITVAVLLPVLQLTQGLG